MLAWKKRKKSRVGLPATGMQRWTTAATRKRPSAVVGRCERCHGKIKWKLETVSPCTNLELQYSRAALAHRMRSGSTWNILGRIRLELTAGLKQILAFGVRAGADHEAWKESVPVLLHSGRARPPRPSKAIWNLISSFIGEH